MKKIEEVLVIVGLILISLSFALKLFWKIDEERCYNMPLNRVYEDKLCQLHMETYEEMNRR